MPYVSNTDKDRKEMLEVVGVEKFEDLISDIPKEYLVDGELDMESGKSEWEVASLLRSMSKKNLNTLDYTSYLGAGSYDHYIPSTIGAIITRPEFQTAYTPYQAEISQGTLQTIFEFQSLVCRLTGMDVSNASMYDGATALAEAALLALGQTKKSKILYPATLHPAYKSVLKTYAESEKNIMIEIPEVNGRIDLEEAKKLIDNDTAGVIVQTPNFYGIIEECEELVNLVHSVKGLFIMAVDPISLGIMKKPSEIGADIVVAEGQALGMPQSFGGPYLGIFATTSKLMRKIPGRIVGLTEDADGKRGFVLTLQTREQHIRRDKATSNICSNQALCALTAGVYMTTLGKKGFKDVSENCYVRSHYLAKGIEKIDGYRINFNAPFFKEFVVKTPIKAAELVDKMMEKGIFAGIPLSSFGMQDDLLLVAVTEKRSKEELDFYIKSLTEIK
ncbi:MAG: aminomethyl-transferring glycine dehydrogenase subunit GcvPA [Candidatus Delongbacteria bacterium]|nr:aminomethyl-transferring glycine dehydrogenase subunit GcvPA [Candidatus Delongbacteria bacterium]MBN2835587.1 aminomethyl-transferring glycine dehydrogenase subunit GcvPA [Candidatus Delongbacteria bacterium]